VVESKEKPLILFQLQEALKINVIDFVVASSDSLLAIIDGMVIKLDNGSERIMKTKGVAIITIEMTWRQRLFDTIMDPNVAAVLLMIGMAGIMLELYNPGTILPGVAGSISLILAWYAMDVLPVNYAGLSMIVLSVIMFLLEIKVPSYGILTIGGVIALATGLVLLIDSSLPELQVSWQVIVGIVITTTLFFVFALGFALKAQKASPTTGSEGLVGEQGVVIKKIDLEGSVQIHGEIWKAMADQVVKKNCPVEVIAYDGKGLILKVQQV